MTNILIAEDDDAIRNLIKINLVHAGYTCQTASDGMEAADLIQSKNFDLALLDIMLPEINGYELLEYASGCSVPVIFITALGNVDQRIKGLKLGADDYIVKPFDVMEMLARVEAVLRRYNKANDRYIIGDVEIDLNSHKVSKQGKNVTVTPKEFSILVFLVQNKNIALTRDQIYEHVWSGEFHEDSRTVDLHIQRLKKKLGLQKQIRTIYKLGYRLEI